MKSESAIYTAFEFESEGHPASAIINTDLKNADKQQYPYSVFIQIVPDTYNEMGHPQEEEENYLNEIKKKIIEYLETQTQTVHVGHVTVYRLRQIVFYTKSQEVVENFLDYFLSTIERESSFDIEQDSGWNNVSAFYELL